MMIPKSMKVLNIVAGVLLIAIGIYCLCNQDIAVLSAGLMVGIFMLISGVIEIIAFAATSGLLFGSGWLLLDGVLTVILSLFLLFNQWFTMMSRLGVGFSNRHYSDDCRIHLHDGSVGKRCGDWFNGWSYISAGRCQFHRVYLYPAKQVSSA